MWLTNSSFNMEDEQVAGILQPGHAEAAVLREQATVPLLLKSGTIQDIKEPEASRADDPDSCLQYSVNAVSGETQAPPKTEDGGETEEVDATLSTVYVRIHTGGSQQASMLKTEEVAPPSAAEHAGDGSSSPEHALHAEQCNLPTGSGQEAAPAVAQHLDDETAAPAVDAKPASTEQVPGKSKELAQAAANWEGVYQDVLKRIHSSKASGEGCGQPLEHAASVDSEQQQEEQQAGDQQHASAQSGPGTAVELQAAQMAAHAIAAACTEPDGDVAPLVPADLASSAAGLAQMPAATSTQENPMQASPAVHAAHEAVQDACSSGHNTPVVLPADAADLPVQAVLDELDSLLAKSDELRSSVQLRSSRQLSDQHGSSLAAAGKDSLSVLDRPPTGTAAASHGSSTSASRSRQSADWDAAAGHSSQASGAVADGDKCGSSQGRPSTGDGDFEDSFKRTVLDSTEVRDEIRQHLQMVVGAAGGEQEASDRRDAATSVGGLITPRKEQQQGSPSHLVHSSVGGTGPKLQDTLPDRGVAAAAPAGDEAACEPDSTAGTCRGSHYHATDSISSMDKLHALYARYTAGSSLQRPSSTGDLALPGSSNTGRQSRRTTGTVPTISATASATASAPMCSSLPFSVTALATATQPSGSRGERRSRSLSPQKAPRQAHALNQDNLQQHQEAHRQHGCARQLQHSVSLCSSCGGPLGLQRGASLHSRAGSAGNQAFDPAAPAALPSKGLAAITGSSDAAGTGIHTSSDLLPSTRISLSALMAGGGLSADQLKQQLTTAPEPCSGREEAAALRASGTRSAFSTSPVRGPQGAKAGGYMDRSPQWGTLSTSAVPARRAASHSPQRHRGAQGAASPTVGHSDIILSKEGVGMATLSFGQLLQETAVEQALGQLQQDVASSLHSTPRTSPQRAAAVPAAAACGADALTVASEAVQEAGSVLQVVPEDGVVVGPANKPQPSPRHTYSINRRHLALSSPIEVHSCANPDHVPPCSPAAPAAAAALKQLAQSTARDSELQQQPGPRILSHCGSMQDMEHSISHRSSCADPRRLTTSSSMRSQSSALSAGGSKVWRPGGNRTDPRDDYRKLQTYESARLKALVKQGLLSPGCSTRLLLLGVEAAEGTNGTVKSPKSRRSTANDLATPVSPGPPSHFASAPASPSSAASPGGYAAASARRKLGLAASPAAAGSVASAAAAATAVAAASPSPKQARSAGRPVSAPAARAGALRAVGSKAVLEPAYTSVFLADLSSASPPGPQRCTSPNVRKKTQRKATSPHPTQHGGSVLGSQSAAKPAKQPTQQQRAGISPSRSGRKQTYASTAVPAASGRPQSGHMLQPLGDSRRAPSSGNSTTAQVEEAIRAAQAALLEKKRQVTYARQALNHMRASAGGSKGYNKQAAASPSMQADVDDDGVACVRDSDSIWGGSSCTSSYRGGRISKDLAAAFVAAGASQCHNSTTAAVEAEAAALQASADPAHPANAETNGEGHSSAGLTGLDNGGKCYAAAASAFEDKPAAQLLTGAPAGREASAVSTYTVLTVQASSKATQPSGRTQAASELTPFSQQQDAIASALFAKPSAVRSPVQQQGRDKSRSPKRRPMSALEELLGLSPEEEDPEDSPQQPPVWPSSAQPVMGSLRPFSPRGRSSSPVSAAKRAAAAGGARQGKAAPQLSVQAGGVAARRSSGGGNGICVPEPWSAPRRRSSAGLTGEQLMELHMRRSAAEAAEAAAAAAEGDLEAAECCEHTMPLDVLVRAYTALNKKNKNSSERTAAVAMLLNQITEGSAAHAGTSQDAAQASPPAHQGADNSPRLDVLGRGLGLCLPESPSSMGPGSSLGFANGPASPSAIIQTLKADSLSSWHRTSPERQAAHASLLSTPKHKQASSYAADLAALAAASSSTNLYSDRSVHNKADSSPASAGKQQQQQLFSSGAPADASAGDVLFSAEPSLSQPHTRQGSVTGAAPRGCTPLRGARLSSSQSGAAPDVGIAHLHTQEHHLSTQPEEAAETAELSIAPPAPRKAMADTATGRLVLDSIGAHDMTVSAALTWLKAGLQTPEQAQAARAASPRPRSPKRLGHSQPCSPFSCFGGKARAMARSSDGSDNALGAVGSPEGQQQQEAQQGASADGVTFQMGADNRLVMVIQQAGTAGPQRLQVTGIRLHPDADHGTGSSASHALDLITDGGSHTIELASESDWAGLVVGLNSMLLLLEQQEAQEVDKLGAMAMGQVVWSTAVLGVADA